MISVKEIKKCKKQQIRTGFFQSFLYGNKEFVLLLKLYFKKEM